MVDEEYKRLVSEWMKLVMRNLTSYTVSDFERMKQILYLMGDVYIDD